jgi:methionyl aminopeptidase
MIPIKTRDELKRMHEACQIAAGALESARTNARAGMTTRELDHIVTREIERHGAKPSFYRYNGFPGHICISINDEVVHGIPGDRVMCEGDIVSVDIGAYYRGFHSDTADTIIIGAVDPKARRLVENTRACFMQALAFAVPGAKLGDMGHAIANHAGSEGFAPVRVLTGHGIGRELHEEPMVLNYGRPGTGETLKPGMVIAIEPMINQGTHRVAVQEDGWTVVTADGKLSAHYEHTVAITDDGPWILTALLEEAT